MDFPFTEAWHMSPEELWVAPIQGNPNPSKRLDEDHALPQPGGKPMTVNASWYGEDGVRYSVVQSKPSMTPHMVITRPGDSPRGRPATAAEIAAAVALPSKREGA